MSKKSPRRRGKMPQSKRAGAAAAALPERRWPWVAIGCGALMLRFLYSWQIHASDLATVLMGDAKEYDDWAQRIAAGDWLGEGVFYQAPLYPYFLGVLFTIFGHALGVARIVQSLIGAASCVLLGRAGQHFFSRPVGLVAGALLALDPTAIFFDCLIQKAVLDLFFFTLVLMLTGMLVSQPPTGRRWLALGAALGLLTLTRENALVILPWLLLLAWELGKSSVAVRPWRSAGMLLLGTVLVLLPVGLRNLVVGGEFHLTTSQLGPNFYIGNHAGADGTYQPLRPQRGDPQFERLDATEMAERDTGRELTPGEVSSYWMSKSFDFIRHEPGKWLSLLWQKWFLVWNAVELGDTEEQAAYERFSPLLAGLSACLHFGVVCPLAILGVVWTWNDRKRLWILYAMALTYALSVAVFFVFARYRLPLVPLAILFAAAGIVAGVRHWRELPARARVVGVMAALATAVFVNWPAEAASHQTAITFSNLGFQLAKQGKLAQAATYFRWSVEAAPNYYEAQFGRGTALFRLGQIDAAEEHFRKAIELNPKGSEAWFNLGIALGSRGQLDEAIACFHRTIELDPHRADAYQNLANVLARQGKTTESLENLERAVQVDPKFGPAYSDLGAALATAGRTDDAAKALEMSVRLQPDLWQGHYNLGRFKASHGDSHGAVAALQRALKLIPHDSPYLPELRSLLADETEKLERSKRPAGR